LNTRERFLSITLLGVVILGVGGFTANALLLEPIWERSRSVEELKKDIQNKESRRNEILAQRSKLERFRALSLPADVDLARRDYEKYLIELLSQSGVAPGSRTVIPKAPDAHAVPTLPNKEPVYTRLEYVVQARSGLEGLVKFLESFYHAPLLHRIKTISIQKPATSAPGERAGELDVNLTVEALVVKDAAHRQHLLPGIDARLLAIDAVTALRRGPSGLGLALWGAGPTGPLGPRTLAQPTRDYLALVQKDIYMGPALSQRTQEVDVLRQVYLNSITSDERRIEAWIYDRYRNGRQRLWANLQGHPERGFDSILVKDEKDATLVQGKAVRIEENDILLLVDGKYYNLHIGQSLGEALSKPVASREEIEKSFAALANLAGW
jgi:hypothetical protein